MRQKPFSKMTQEEKEYLFDLNGYLVIDNALDGGQLAWINQWIDSQPKDLPTGTWLGNVELHTYGKADGLNYQNIIEGGKVFEQLIDNSVWIGLVRRLIENDYNRISMNECFLNIRREGGFIGIHSGGHLAAFTSSFRSHAGAWMVGQINILMALQDVNPGDGVTVVVPGSHKSHEIHPALRPGDPARPNSVYRTDKPDETLGAIEVPLKAGQALMFTDAILHGGSSRTNPGERRILIYRYSPHSMQSRYNYVPSEELLSRLTPAQKAIIQPVAARMAPGRSKATA
jgi:hypothetical protein